MKQIKLTLSLLLICTLISCKPLISLYDQDAYKKDIDLKVDFQFLIDKSKEPYEKHEDARTEYLRQLYKGYEYEKGRDHNELTVKQYVILIKVDGPVLGFFSEWKRGNTLNDVFRREVREQSDAIFDELIKLESIKRKEGFKLNLAGDNQSK